MKLSFLSSKFIYNHQMENIPNNFRQQSIHSLQSTISKTEKGLALMDQKGANITLIEKRLQAFKYGLAALEHVWNEKPIQVSLDEMTASRQILVGLLPSIRDQYAKSKTGSPQQTLLERRIKSFEMAVQAMDEIIGEP